YFVSRAARIYSVALPALIVTFVLDAIGRSMRPDLYTPVWGYVATGQLWQFVSGLFFVNQIWFSNVSQGSDLPYWSLGYEVWYYLIFGIAVFARGPWRVMGILGALIFVGPPIATMFPLWLLGCLSYRVCAQLQLNRFFGALICLGSIAVWFGYEIWVPHDRLLNLAPPFLNHPTLAQDYLVGILFAT